MRAPWFYCPSFGPGEVALVESEARHALRSLRLERGDPLVLFDGTGTIGPGTLSSERGEAPTVHIAAVERVAASARRLTLIVAACKGPRLAWLVEKATELAVTRLVLARFERSVVVIGAGHCEKLRRTAIEACKQCRRAWLPEIRSDVALNEALGAAELPILVAHPEPDAIGLATWLTEHCAGSGLTAVVGPEGGLSDQEIAVLTAAACDRVRLGPHILRVETAALAIAAAWAAGL